MVKQKENDENETKNDLETHNIKRNNKGKGPSTQKKKPSGARKGSKSSAKRSNSKNGRGNSNGGKAKRSSIDRKKKRMSKKTTILIAVVVIIIVLIIGVGGMGGGEDYMTVSDILEDEGKYLDKYIEVRGVVKEESWDMFNRSFILIDDDNEMFMNYTELLPSNFEEGKDVVVKGTLRNKEALEIEVKDIEVGCPSKY